MNREEEAQRKENISQPTTSSRKVDPKPSTPFHLTPPFPSRFTKSKGGARKGDTRDFLQSRDQHTSTRFHQAGACYAKFLKELCTSKCKLKGNEKVSVGENISAFLQRKLPIH